LMPCMLPPVPMTSTVRILTSRSDCDFLHFASMQFS
jgi:hypothetical protein